MSSKKSFKNLSNFELPSIENQEYIFKNKFYKQELLNYEEGQERKVSILLLYIYIYYIY